MNTCLYFLSGGAGLSRNRWCSDFRIGCICPLSTRIVWPGSDIVAQYIHVQVASLTFELLSMVSGE